MINSWVNFLIHFLSNSQNSSISTFSHHNRGIKVKKRDTHSSSTDERGRGTVTSGTFLSKHLHTIAAAQRLQLSHLLNPPTKNISRKPALMAGFSERLCLQRDWTNVRGTLEKGKKYCIYTFGFNMFNFIKCYPHMMFSLVAKCHFNSESRNQTNKKYVLNALLANRK